ncbi:hypothetical protein PTW35_20765 (plasmid) [Photobacterium sp. DA100]|uniref:hypothetical protein n=1 Tax=Photobacterium sp. DA100 TaxID=3027472 RepID=UPI002479D8FD|nr:hypothetical protein [Photobacterium sp. DA100]WEM45514.1 hypothetical protein PTW35_20765 [Photobacterium sp. DA100]
MNRQILCQTFQVAATALLLVGCGSDSDSTTIDCFNPDVWRDGEHLSEWHYAGNGRLAENQTQALRFEAGQYYVGYSDLIKVSMITGNGEPAPYAEYTLLDTVDRRAEFVGYEEYMSGEVQYSGEYSPPAYYLLHGVAVGEQEERVSFLVDRRHGDGGREQHTEVRQVFSNQGIVTLELPGGEELQACHFRLDEQRIHLLDAGENESGVGYTELWVDTATGLTVKRVREFDYQGPRDALQTEELLISYHIDGVKVF